MTDSATFTLRPIPKAAFIAGYAGLLPQIIAAAMVVSGSEYRWTGLALAYGYAAFIFSFIGGMWWALGATTRKDDTSANGIFALAVAPSLLALATYAPWILGWEWPGPSMAWLGFFLLLSPLADRWLSARCALPAGWMQLRWHLSIGLGGLTLLLAGLA
jgi:cbb3-type cytochrome oxidase subunit 3